MICIKNKKDCCGCTACMAACPKQCINMEQDKEGFSYPVVDEQRCVKCGKCLKVCPFKGKKEKKKPIACYAMKHPNPLIQIGSSSGGAFSFFAEQIINQGGVVFGAAFNEQWDVVHRAVESVEDLRELRGSKYVQSNMSDCYQQVRKVLKDGRKVLFSGTPCQVSGLIHYLGKRYDNLITLDFICHGVPSPKVWAMYLQLINKQIIKKNPNVCIEEINHREKSLGWKKFSLYIRWKGLSKIQNDHPIELKEYVWDNLYMKAFLGDLILRPSCYCCKMRCGRSGSSLTVGDFWGCDYLQPNVYDEHGISAVMVNSQEGLDLVDRSLFKKVDFEKILIPNQAIYYSPLLHHQRRSFFKNIDNMDLEENITRHLKAPLTQKIEAFAYRAFRFIKKHIQS